MKRLCAVLTLEGSWIDMKKRKLADPVPAIVFEVLNAVPKSEAFENYF
jgi:acyl-CoA thioester hydrolase